MRITNTRWTLVQVPVKPDAVNSPEWGDDAWPEIGKHIVEVETDEGITGIGETNRGVPTGAVQSLAQALQGTDPLALCLQALPTGERYSTTHVGGESVVYPARSYEYHASGNPAYDAFEMALYDLVGKALGVPAHRLLGTAVREWVPVNFWMGRRNPADAGRKARAAEEAGYHGLKMKSALEDPVVEVVEAIVDATSPAFRIVLDPNERYYRPAEALQLAYKLAPYADRLLFEDPVPKWNLDAYRLLRERSPIPIAVHLGDPRSLIPAIKAEACDYVNVGTAFVSFVKAAIVADAAGLLIWHGSGVDLGIREAAFVHACAVSRNCVLPSDIFGELVREDDLLADPLEIEDGYVAVPTGPGLGVELDREALAHYAVADD